MHVVSRPPQPFVTRDGSVRVHTVLDASDNLVWIAECVQTRQAVVIDGPTAGPALQYAERNRLNIVAVWNTHTHGDHVGINHDLARSGKLDGLEVAGPASRASEIPGLTFGVTEGDAVRIGSVEGRVMLTEGHLDGHVSYVMGDVVFCGDTLFAGGCGYLFDGPPSAMFDSLLRLAALPGETRVCCAHEYTQDNLRFAWSVEPDNEALPSGSVGPGRFGPTAAAPCLRPSTRSEPRIPSCARAPRRYLPRWRPQTLPRISRRPPQCSQRPGGSRTPASTSPRPSRRTDHSGSRMSSGALNRMAIWWTSVLPFSGWPAMGSNIA